MEVLSMEKKVHLGKEGVQRTEGLQMMDRKQKQGGHPLGEDICMARAGIFRVARASLHCRFRVRRSRGLPSHGRVVGWVNGQCRAYWGCLGDTLCTSGYGEAK